LGDLFVVRLAGNVVDNAALGSIEYSVDDLDVPLVMVLGHERCGAVSAAVKAVQGNAYPPYLHNIVRAIAVAARSALRRSGDPVDNAIREHVEMVVRE